MNSAVAFRTALSPNRIIRSRHDSLIVRTNRSACAFKLGLRGGSFTDATPASASRLRKLGRKQRIAIMHEVALAIKQAIHGIRQVAADLIHPQPTGTRRDPSNLHLPGRQFQEKQDDKPL